MLEYDIDEAESLLEKNLATATKNLDSLEEDLDFLRDQFTTTEVSILTEGCWCARILTIVKIWNITQNMEVIHRSVLCTVN